MIEKIGDASSEDLDTADHGGNEHFYNAERDKGKEDQHRRKELKSQLYYRKYMNAVIVLMLSMHSAASKISKAMQTAKQTVIEKFSGPKNFHDVPLRNEIGSNQASVDMQSALISPKISPNKGTVSEEQSVVDKKIHAQKLSPGTKLPWSARKSSGFSMTKMR
ncbi:MAG: hypothetical protein MK137_05135 [Rickettsiales bacterium]|nr:hypothetical protein [Rickettsiales bacterium]